jgi:chromate transporter
VVTPEVKGEDAAQSAVARGSVLEVLWVATKLGLTCFGGPIAHLGYFRDEYVVKRKWLDEKLYADLVALCQFLPGAASSKLGMSIGILRAGPLGGIAAWIGFTLPSAAALVIVGLLLQGVGAQAAAWLYGLKVVAVVVVSQAVWGMAQNLTPDRKRASMAVLAAAATFVLPTAISQIAVIAVAAVIGWRFLRGTVAEPGPPVAVPIPRPVGVAAWVLFLGLLVGLPIARSVVSFHPLEMLDSFYRSGALVFGGGHVVLPLLQAQVVPPHWISNQDFLTGYGLAQAVPGPLFTFSAYLGAVMGPAPNGVLGAAIALIGIFLPSFLLTIGALPWWGTLRAHPHAQAALRGVNAGVVGLLLSALYNPVWTSAIHNVADFGLALVAFCLLVIWRRPPWMVVLFTVAAGAGLYALGVRG